MLKIKESPEGHGVYEGERFFNDDMMYAAMKNESDFEAYDTQAIGRSDNKRRGVAWTGESGIGEIQRYSTLPPQNNNNQLQQYVVAFFALLH